MILFHGSRFVYSLTRSKLPEYTDREGERCVIKLLISQPCVALISEAEGFMGSFRGIGAQTRDPGADNLSKPNSHFKQIEIKKKNPKKTLYILSHSQRIEVSFQPHFTERNYCNSCFDFSFFNYRTISLFNYSFSNVYYYI